MKNKITAFIDQLQAFGITITELPTKIVFGCPSCEHQDGLTHNFIVTKRSERGMCKDCNTITQSFDEVIGFIKEQQKINPVKFAEAIRTGQAKYDVKMDHNHEPLIGASQFEPMSSDELVEILGLTIKKDVENKKIAFLAQLSAYTESSQLNVSFNAPSSTGKSYIPTEIARLFPQEDVVEIGYCSPTAFFHEHAQGYNKEKNELMIDLSRKILIFLDQPHTLLLQHLRPILSHDKKIIKMKITDREQKGGLRTKNVSIKGFPVVIFCTAGLEIDEQESTRFILLSPQTNVEKIREAILQRLKKEKDPEAYHQELENDPRRKLLKERIFAIKMEGIEDVKIASPEKVEQMFFASTTRLKPRHSRDIGKIISLIKAFALLNLWFRAREGSILIANDDDIDEAFKVWSEISESQELSLPPYIYAIYKEVLSPLWKADIEAWEGREVQSDLGKTTREITKMHFEVYGRPLAEWLWQQMIAPMLETAGLIYRDHDAKDKRVWLYYPTAPLTTFTDKPITTPKEEERPSLNDPFPTRSEDENNNESDPGVDDDQTLPLD